MLVVRPSDLLLWARSLSQVLQRMMSKRRDLLDIGV